MDELKYEFLDRRVIILHREQEVELSRAALDEVSKFERVQFYSRERMAEISEKGGIQEEVNKLVRQVLAERRLHPDGSNTECIAMDLFTEFLSNLDLEDFRLIGIERLIDEAKSD